MCNYMCCLYVANGNFVPYAFLVLVPRLVQVESLLGMLSIIVTVSDRIKYTPRFLSFYNSLVIIALIHRCDNAFIIVNSHMPTSSPPQDFHSNKSSLLLRLCANTAI